MDLMEGFDLGASTGANDCDEDDIFKVIDMYFEGKVCPHSHLHESFDKFLSRTLPNLLLEGDHVFNETIRDGHVVRDRLVFRDVVVETPRLEGSDELLFPSTCRDKHLTYSSRVYASVKQVREVVDIGAVEVVVSSVDVGDIDKRKHVATIPTMVRSSFCNLSDHDDDEECQYDPGGYFIVGGMEKMVVCQDKLAPNRVTVFEKRVSGAAPGLVSQVVSRSDSPVLISQLVSVRLGKNDTIMLKLSILQEVNVIALFRCLGVITDKEIIECCCGSADNLRMVEIVTSSMAGCVDDDGSAIVTKDESIEYVARRLRVIPKGQDRKSRLDSLLSANLFPHVTSGSGDPSHLKGLYLGLLINKLLRVHLGEDPPDDRDSYLNKRVDNIDELFQEVTLQQYKANIGECSRALKSRTRNDPDEVHNVAHHFKPSTIAHGLQSSLTRGDWVRRKGVAQSLARTSYMQLLTYCSRIDTQTGNDSAVKVTKPRQVDPSSVPFLCPVQTPEHSSIGMTKHLSLMSSLTIGDQTNTNLVREFLTSNPLVDSSVLGPYSGDYFGVSLDGLSVGVVKNDFSDGVDHNPLISLYVEAKSRKIKGEFDRKNTSVSIDVGKREIRFLTDSGRLVRPVIRVKDNLSMLTKEVIEKATGWDNLVNESPYPIEYIDADEQYTSLVAQSLDRVVEERRKSALPGGPTTVNTKLVTDRYDDNTYVRYSHLDFHGSMNVGANTASIPFCEKNQGPRNIFQYSQGKQATSLYLTTYRRRYDISYVLYRPELPLVETRASKYSNSDVLPSGNNVIVAIATYSGYNQEDSLIFNKTALERGLFRSTNLKKYSSSITRSREYGLDRFMKPPENTIGMMSGSYDKIDGDGLIKEECEVVDGDVVFGKVSPISNTSASYKDSSEYYKSIVPGRVDKVKTTTNSDGYEMRSALIRSDREPIVGDKFACYSRGHLVLTARGYIPIETLELGDLVARVSGDFAVEYVKPVELHSYACHYPMVSVVGEGVNLLVTWNHTMVILLGRGVVKVRAIDIVSSFVQIPSLDSRRVECYASVVPPEAREVYCCTVGGSGIISVKGERSTVSVVCGNSRHGQKGVIGIALPGPDMPFTTKGIRPDVIMNPNAIPSRMTMAQLCESVFGKAGALVGERVDGTPFCRREILDPGRVLESHGYDKCGEERMYNGMTGDEMTYKIFIGPCYMQRLKHMVSDKMHSRASGPLSALTRQAPEGRARDGGSRIGEMERDAIISHGMSRVLKEVLMDNSDAYLTRVCSVCGSFASRVNKSDSMAFPSKRDVYTCAVCETPTPIKRVKIPYAFKVLVEELLSLGVTARIIPETKSHTSC